MKKIRDKINIFREMNEKLSNEVYSDLRRIQMKNKVKWLERDKESRQDRLIAKYLFKQQLVEAFENTKVTSISEKTLFKLQPISRGFEQHLREATSVQHLLQNLYLAAALKKKEQFNRE